MMTAVGVAIDGGKRNRRRRNWVGCCGCGIGRRPISSFFHLPGGSKERENTALTYKGKCTAEACFLSDARHITTGVKKIG